MITGMAPTPEELLAHAGWLRRLAVSLVGPAAGADDLVQETWLAALRHPPARPGPLRPWLAQVLRNLVRMRRRAQGVRTAKQPEAQRLEEERGAPAIASPEALLGKLEVERLLARLVAELDEPYRQTVLLRYFEGWSAADIARRLGVPAGTVRWRLKTGLDRLRAALDREAHGDRRSWRLALAPLASSRTPAGAAMKGLWLMTRAQKGVLAGALLLALLGLGVVLVAVPLRGGGGERGVASAPAAAGTSAPGPTAATGPAPAAPTGVAMRTPAPSQLMMPARLEHDAALAHGALSGRVLNFSSGEGVGGAQVTFGGGAGGGHSVTADRDGAFRFEPPQAGVYTLAVVTAPGYLPYAPDWGTSAIALAARPGLHIRDVTVYLVPALDYTGLVVDAAGAPVAGAEVRLRTPAAGELVLAPITDRYLSDETGHFVFHAPDEALLEASKPGVGIGRARLSREAEISHRLTITLRPARDPAAERAIHGRVVWAGADARPVPGAAVLALPEGGDGLRTDAGAQTGADGRFTIAGLDTGAYTVRATCSGCARAQALVEAGAEAEVTLRVEAGTKVAGRVVAAGGAPVPSFTVFANRRTGPLTEETVAEATVLDGEGHFELAGLAEGDYRVRAAGFGHAVSPPVDVHLTRGEEASEVVITAPAGGTIYGRVIERGSGKPLELARVSVDSSAGNGNSAVPLVANTLTDARGEFELGGIPPGLRSAVAAAYGHHVLMRSGLAIDDGGRTGPLVFELSATRDGEAPTFELFGVGASLAAADDTLLIQRVIADGGAARAGLVAGDAILRIDGVPVTALGLDDSIQRIRGPEGSVVVLAVRRHGVQAAVDVPVTRVRITY
jgi:RNA polymerase sigma factor (sigma-70 family)